MRLRATPAGRLTLIPALAAALLLPCLAAAPVGNDRLGRLDLGSRQSVVTLSVAGQSAAPAGRTVKVRLLADMRYPAKRGVTAVPVGAHLRLRVRLPAQAASGRVRLQVRRTRWQTLATAPARRHRTVATFRVPTRSPGREQYRVLTAATGSEVAPAPFTVEVRVEPGPDEPTTPPGVVPAPPGPQGPGDAWTLLDTGRPGTAFRWDPCTPIRYRTHLDGAPTALAADVSEAVQRLSAATGLHFVDMGSTDYAGTFADPEQLGWPADVDLLVSVADEAAAPALAGDTVGYASITRGTWSSTDERIDRAEVVLEKAFVTTAPTGFGTQEAGTASLLLHELGHAVGLGHTAVVGQAMYPTISSGQPPQYEAGDLNGLARVGATGGCLTTT